MLKLYFRRSMRIIQSFPISKNEDLLKRLLYWSSQEGVSCLLTSNQHWDRNSQFEILFGTGIKSQLKCDAGNAFEKLSLYRNQTQDWLMGFLGYDLKNEVEEIQSQNPDDLHFPDMYFFQPLKLVRLTQTELQFLYLHEVASDIETDYNLLVKEGFQEVDSSNFENPKIKVRFNKDAYCEQVSKMLDHIKRGDIYEANFCQEFYADAAVNPYESFLKLNTLSRAPFAAFLKLKDHYALCSSPERYLQKMGDTLISQPIKGTARRGRTEEEDALLKQNLENDPKERAENIMITDLVRNDLSKVAVRGSVTVAELCKIHSFDQVHQMISTIEAKLPADLDPVQSIKNSFPMGSMTGAPKLSAMQIIEDLENRRRGFYSGSIGYFTPDGDFDFNVVIRSILYNSTKKYLSFTVGSAITAQAIPEKEYEECLLKAKAMRDTLSN